MRRRHLRTVLLLVSALGIGTYASMASGANAAVEKEAKKLQGDAMDVDFLSLDYKSAKKKLDEAIKKCGASNCSDALAAALHRDLGVVLINDKKVKDGQKAFDEAFKSDPSITISPDYLANKDVAAAWAAAKKAGGGAPTATATPTASATGPVKPPPTAAGNLTVPTKIAPTTYPLPVVIEAPDGLEVENMKFSYKTAAMEKYKTIEAKKDGGKYVITIPCEDTQFVGDIKFYVRAYDAEKNEVEHFGTIKSPGVLKLVEKMPDDVEAPTYPGGKEPTKCQDKANCQPGFPCADGDKKPAGSGCDNDDECQSGLECTVNDNGKKWCAEKAGGPGDGPKTPVGGPKIWLGADFQLDTLILFGDKNVCRSNSWACSNGRDIGVAADKGIQTWNGTDTIPARGGNTGTGFGIGTARVLLGLDYFLNGNMSLGGRLGYAFNGNPTSTAKFMPFHLEARFQYFLGAPKSTGSRPYLMLGAGLGQFDAAVSNVVVEVDDTSKEALGDDVDPDGNPRDAARHQADCTADRTKVIADGTGPAPACQIKGVKAYRLAGQGFLAPGGGVWIHLAPKVILNIGAKILLPLPTFSPGFSLEVGIKFGLGGGAVVKPSGGGEGGGGAEK